MKVMGGGGRHGGFTLIELSVALVVIGIIISIAAAFDSDRIHTAAASDESNQGFVVVSGAATDIPLSTPISLPRRSGPASK